MIARPSVGGGARGSDRVASLPARRRGARYRAWPLWRLPSGVRVPDEASGADVSRSDGRCARPSPTRRSRSRRRLGSSMAASDHVHAPRAAGAVRASSARRQTLTRTRDFRGPTSRPVSAITRSMASPWTGANASPGSSSNTTPAISTSSPGSNPSRPRARAITPMRAQPVLDVGQRLLVLEVVAGDQALDRLAGHAELAVADALDLEAAARPPGRKTWNSATSSSPAASPASRARRPARGAAARARARRAPGRSRSR